MADVLTPKLDQVMQRLAACSGPVDRWSLVEEITPFASASADDGVLRTYVSRLRTKLGPNAIRTVRFIGYQLTDEGRAAYARMSA